MNLFMMGHKREIYWWWKINKSHIVLTWISRTIISKSQTNMLETRPPLHLVHHSIKHTANWFLWHYKSLPTWQTYPTKCIRLPEETNTTKICKLKKNNGLTDKRLYWYLKLREEPVKLGVYPTQLDNGIFLRFCNDKLFGIMAYFVDDLLWGGETLSFSS